MLSEIKIFSNIQDLQHFYHMEMFFEIILKWSNPAMCNVFCKVQYIKYFGFERSHKSSFAYFSLLH